MILSDKTIAALCDPDPEARFDVELYVARHFDNILGPEIDGLRRRLRDEEVRDLSYIPWEPGERADYLPMIEPFLPRQVREGEFGQRTISSGLTSYGYDVRIGREAKIFSNLNSSVIDPKNLDDGCLVDAMLHEHDDGSEFFIVPPNSYLLSNTPEYFSIPRNILVVCVGKSTYARAGVQVNVTPIEPGFEGNVVIEIANSTTLPLRVYANEGIAQFLFLLGEAPCGVSYGDRHGKYQGQRGITLPKV